DRTLTVREAARLQTFPDHVRFAGTPTAAFRQIGNAVPPMLAREIGSSIRRALAEGIADDAKTTRQLSLRLSEWVNHRYAAGEIGTPWHTIALAHGVTEGPVQTRLRWSALLALLLFDRVPIDVARSLWPALVDRLPDPATTIERGKEL